MIGQIKHGSIISESSHYIVNRVSGSDAWLIFNGVRYIVE